MSEISEIIETLAEICGRSSVSNPIGLHEPDFRETRAWEYVKDCLDTGWVSTAGKWVSRFEQELCKYTKAEYAIAVTNGTVALRLGLHLVGVKPGDEVLMPPMSFVATANAVSHLGAIPHFVDIESNTFGICPQSLADRLGAVGEKRIDGLFNRETGRRIAAVVPVHIFGNPAEVDKVKQVCEQWNIALVEDAAEALGSWLGETHCGLIGEIGALSFNGNKLLTTGGGGALITNSSTLAERARHLSTTAKLSHPWEFKHDLVGWNDRMPNINAALGVAQLEVLDQTLEMKEELAELYRCSFERFEDVEFVTPTEKTSSNHWLNCLRFLDKQPDCAQRRRLEVLERAHAQGILLRPVWNLLHELPMYVDMPRANLPTAKDQASRLLNLPSSPQLIKR